MGYTHYWWRTLELDTKLFRKAATDCRSICNALPFLLGNGLGVGMPIFDERKICFNGSKYSQHFANSQPSVCWSFGEFSELQFSDRQVSTDGDGSFETFAVPRCRDADDLEENGQYFDFCKTGRRPYDLNVQACLIILNHHFGNDLFRVQSDGDNEEWNDARQVCHAVLRFGLDFQLTNNN